MTPSIESTFVSDLPTAPRAGPSSATMLRQALIGGCAVAAVSVFAFADAGATTVDADLALLLHGMAAIKTLMVVAAVAILSWRFGHAIERRFAVGYLIGALLVSVATAMIWRLTAIAPAAVVFHVGVVLLLVVAWRDDGAPLRHRVPRTR